MNELLATQTNRPNKVEHNFELKTILNQETQTCSNRTKTYQTQKLGTRFARI